MKSVVKILFVAVFIQLTIGEIEVPKNAFKVWRQIQKTTQMNHIKLRFKTIHATGLIMYARGANKKDFLSVELYRGKIRIAGNFANGTLNALRPIDGQYEMYAGKDLADNSWHTVEVVRNIRQSFIYIDRGTSQEKMVFSKSPPTYTDLSVSMVTFGGFYSFATSEISTRVAYSRRGFSGCFTEATFSQHWYQLPEGEKQPQNNVVDFINGATTVDSIALGMKAVGTIKSVCEDTVPPYKPLFFGSSPVHIALLQNYTIQKLKLDLKFRTVVNGITLANYTTIATGEQITLNVNRKGRVSLTFDQGKTSQTIETSRQNFHDGEWHSVSFNVDNQPTQEGEYTVQFTVDGKTRLSSMSRLFHFNGFINIGFGFTGCMRDIMINDEDIYKTSRRSDVTNDYFQVVDVGVVHNYCSLKDYCNPNPCMNGGKCNQTDDNIVCDCKGTLYEGSTCHRPRFNYTCAGVRKAGERRSDVYYIDMDGMGPMRPVRALCDLGKTVETTVTQINNTRFTDVDVATPSGINNLDINYEASITQMRELIMNSDYCQQYIKYTCKGTPLFRSPEGPPETSWMGGDDIVHYYWGGAQGKRGYCACGVRGDCKVGLNLIGKYCSCDQLSELEQALDEGNFSIKAHLPVRQLQFKSVLEGSVEALLRVGHLRCAGFGSRDIAATFRKRYSYLSVYHPDQPFDNIQAGGISFDFKSSFAYDYMTLIHAHGPFSGNYIKIMVWSKTMVRVLLDLGFGPLKQDVDISSTGRTLDDNEWHEFNVMFNLKELNVTLDGIHMIQGLPLQEDPVVFTVDATPIYVGGSYLDEFGFIGCIRSLYVNGRIFDIKTIAEGKEEEGVYPGCGSACMLLNRPCNYGHCFDQYDSFKCNCSVSPYGGEFCQNETYPKSFGGGNSIVYNLEKLNQSKPLSSGIYVVGFKTTQESCALGQIEGQNGTHYTLALVQGYLTLYWNLKNKINMREGSLEQRRIEVLQISERKLNTNRHQVVKLEISTREIWIHVSNYNLSVGVNTTESDFFNEDGTAVLGKEPDAFGAPLVIRVGDMQNIMMDNQFQQPSFTGCMSGAKFVYTPHGTREDRFPDAIEIDFFKAISVEDETKESTSSQNDPAITGSFPTDAVDCGPDLGYPGELPTVGPMKQFVTKSPGLDRSVRIPETDWVAQLMIVVIVLVVSVVILILLFVVYKKVNGTMLEYNRQRNREKPQRKQMKFISPMSTNPSRSEDKQPLNEGDTEMEAMESTNDQGMFL